MKNNQFVVLFKWLLISLSLAFPLSIYAAKIDKIVIFGDSLSDNGNIYAFTSKAHKVSSRVPIIPKNPPYYNGRFTNGLVWIEKLAQSMHLDITSEHQLLNYALGGSWAEPYSDSKEIYPFDFATEVGHYLKAALFDFHKDQHLFVIWVGGNDYLSGRNDIEYATSNTVNIVKAQIERLIRAGGKNFLILNLPDLSLTPWAITQGPDFCTQLSKITLLHNSKLSAAILHLQKDHHNIKLVYFDLITQFNDMFINPEKYHLKNVKNACYDGGYTLKNMTWDKRELDEASAYIDIEHNVSLRTAYSSAFLFSSNQCTNADEYLFWDQVHPTQAVHQVIANGVFEILKANDINGPSLAP